MNSTLGSARGPSFEMDSPASLLHSLVSLHFPIFLLFKKTCVPKKTLLGMGFV